MDELVLPSAATPTQLLSHLFPTNSINPSATKLAPNSAGFEAFLGVDEAMLLVVDVPQTAL